MTVATEPIRTDFLVYGECECGWSCACHAGSLWPKCPRCGEDVKPVRNIPRPNRKYAVWEGHGYVAELYTEAEAYSDPRCDVTDAYTPPSDGKEPLRLGEGRMAYRLHTTGEVRAVRQRTREEQQRVAIGWWRRREIRSVRNLPWRYRLHPGTVRALLGGALAQYVTLSGEEFIRWADGDRSHATKRRKRWAQKALRKLSRGPVHGNGKAG